ncbi:MAG: hypothetical protein NZ879_05700 [Archaeoglobaceae archaeon]|nr:hypothetical protein [Archaeoglobaceae archaeon]MDW8118461.1 hypothetical protein [Archaeoglobaceae archaeon]
MEVRLVVDGEEIELNPFVMKIMGKVVEALATSLKGVDESWKRIEIEVVR